VSGGNVFVLAHLSDPHLAPLPQARIAELASKRITGYLNWVRKRRAVHQSDVVAAIVGDLLSQRPDHIAVTGDLVNIALPAEFENARRWLDRLGPPADVSLVPGNHDAYVPAGDALRVRHWAPYMAGDATPRGEAFPYLRIRGLVALIGVSTALPTAPFMATGRLGTYQIARMMESLAANPARFRIVLIHHPPHAVPKARIKRLVDAAAFREAIVATGAELVIHGHDHVRSLGYIDARHSRVPVIGVPSASAASGLDHDPAGYNLYRIDGRPGAWTCEVERRGMNEDGAVTTCERFVV
jgi:3',5'-cyclic AMP phosphodiesterase CpdA